MSDAVVYDLVGELSSVELGAGDIETAGMGQLLADLSITSTVDDALRLIDAAVENVTVDLPPATAATIRGAADSLKEAIRIGEIRPQDAAMAWVWVSYYLHARVLTPADLAEHRLRGWLQTFAATRGWNPPAASTPANPSAAPHAGGGPPVGLYPAPGAYTPPHGVASPGAQSVAAASIGVDGQTVSAPGLSRQAAQAISKALAVTAAESATVTARAIDHMLPGEAPGQVPAQMRQLFTAVDGLLKTVVGLDHLVSGIPSRGLLTDIRRLEGQAAELFDAAHRLEAQMAGEDTSRLLSLLEADQRRIDNQGQWIHHTDEVLATLAPLTVVRELEVEVHDLAGAVANDVPKALGAQVTELQTETQAVRAQVDRLTTAQEACCEEFQQAQQDVGGRPAWKRLGGLLGALYGIGWVVTLIETGVALLDGPAALDAIVVDTETIDNWATAASGIVPAVTGWADRIAGVAS